VSNTHVLPEKEKISITYIPEDSPPEALACFSSAKYLAQFLFQCPISLQ
jgi:hypothetical protein